MLPIVLGELAEGIGKDITFSMASLAPSNAMWLPSGTIQGQTLVATESDGAVHDPAQH